MTIPGDQDRLAENLRRLCAQEKSIAALCRHLDINRQQFMRYLSGKSRPSANNLIRISQHFGVSPASLDQDPALQPSEPAKARSATQHMNGHFDLFFASQTESLDGYLGDYMVYHPTESWKKVVMSAFVRLHKLNDRTYFRASALIRHPTLGTTTRVRKAGQVALSQGHLYVFQYHLPHRTNAALDVIRVNPVAGNRFMESSFLMTSFNQNEAVQGRRIWKFLGHNVNARQAIEASGLKPIQSPDIGEEVRDMLLTEVERLGIWS